MRFFGEPDGPATYPARYHISNCHTSLPQVVASAPRPAFHRGETGSSTVWANRPGPWANVAPAGRLCTTLRCRAKIDNVVPRIYGAFRRIGSRSNFFNTFIRLSCGSAARGDRDEAILLSPVGRWSGRVQDRQVQTTRGRACEAVSRPHIWFCAGKYKRRIPTLAVILID